VSSSVSKKTTAVIAAKRPEASWRRRRPRVAVWTEDDLDREMKGGKA